MSEVDMASAWLSRLRAYRADLMVLFLMIAGFALNIYAPVWFAPPYFQYTFWLYLIIFLAWIPAFIVLMRRKRPARRIIYVVIGGMLLMSFSCFLLMPRSMFAVAVLDSIHCEPLSADPAHVRYACTRSYFESTVHNETLIVDGPSGSPILFLIDTRRP